MPLPHFSLPSFSTQHTLSTAQTSPRCCAKLNTPLSTFQEDGHHVNVGNANTKQVEENLKYDIELYAYAKARFKRDVVAMEARKEAAMQL